MEGTTMQLTNPCLIALELRNAAKALLGLKRVPPEVLAVARALLDHADEVDKLEAMFAPAQPVWEPEDAHLVELELDDLPGLP